MPKIKMAPQITVESMYKTDEVCRTFLINWLGDDKKIFFDASLVDVVSGFYELNRMLFDINSYASNPGFATIADFFRIIGREDLILIYPETEDYGWFAESLVCDCDSYFLNFRVTIIKGKKNTYDIEPEWLPNDHILKRIEEWE